MNSNLKEKLQYIVASILFILGIFLLVNFPQKPSEIEVLPLTGEESLLKAEMSVDKRDIQRDEPVEEARKLNYTLKVSNLASCSEESLDVMFVLDNSGSMNDYLSQVREVGVNILQYLDLSQDKGGVIKFKDEAFISEQLTDDYDKLAQSITAVQARGFTNIGDGIEHATNELTSQRHNKQSKSIVLLFSDGRTNRPSDISASKEYVLSKAEIAKSQGIIIVPIAFGPAVDMSFLAEISSSSVTTYEQISQSDNISMLFADLIQPDESKSYDTKAKVDLRLYEDIVDLANISQAGQYVNGQLVWDVGLLQCRESQVLNFSLEVNNDAPDLEEIDLIATAENSSGSPITSHNTLTTIHAPVLTISLEDKQDVVGVGDTVNLAVVVKNIGSGNAHNVTLRDTFTDNFVFIDVNSITGNAQVEGNIITWNNVGRGFVFDGTFSPTGEGLSSRVFTMSQVVKQDFPDGIYTLEHVLQAETGVGYLVEAVEQTEIQHGADLSINLTATPSGQVSSNGEIDYSVWVKNNGVVNASGVIITLEHTLPELDLVCEDGVETENGIYWNVSLLKVYEERMFSCKANILDLESYQSAVLQMEAYITSGSAELDSSDNIALVENVISTDPYLSVEQTSPALANSIEDQIQFEFVIKNKGATEAYNVIFKQDLPIEFNYILGSSTLDGDPYSNPSGAYDLHWDLGTLSPDKEVVLVFLVEVDEFTSEGNYVSYSNVDWRNSKGESFESLRGSHTVSLVESDSSKLEDIQQEGKDSSDAISDLWKEIAHRMRISNIDIVIGVLLALPLPVLILVAVWKEKGELENEREKKEGRKAIKKVRKKKSKLMRQFFIWIQKLKNFKKE